MTMLANVKTYKQGLLFSKGNRSTEMIRRMNMKNHGALSEKGKPYLVTSTRGTQHVDLFRD